MFPAGYSRTLDPAKIRALYSQTSGNVCFEAAFLPKDARQVQAVNAGAFSKQFFERFFGRLYSSRRGMLGRQPSWCV